MRVFKSKFARRRGKLTLSSRAVVDNDWPALVTQREHELRAHEMFEQRDREAKLRDAAGLEPLCAVLSFARARDTLRDEGGSDMWSGPVAFDGARVPALKEGEVIRLARPEELSPTHTSRAASNLRATPEKRRTGANPIAAILSAAFARLRRPLRRTTSRREGP
jgi:hypothetical protein